LHGLFRIDISRRCLIFDEVILRIMRVRSVPGDLLLIKFVLDNGDGGQRGCLYPEYPIAKAYGNKTGLAGKVYFFNAESPFRSDCQRDHLVGRAFVRAVWGTNFRDYVPQ
jgi:hypothetical protein